MVDFKVLCDEERRHDSVFGWSNVRTGGECFDKVRDATDKDDDDDDGL